MYMNDRVLRYPGSPSAMPSVRAYQENTVEKHQSSCHTYSCQRFLLAAWDFFAWAVPRQLATFVL
jgi:hypothetical protein